MCAQVLIGEDSSAFYKHSAAQTWGIIMLGEVSHAEIDSAGSYCYTESKTLREVKRGEVICRG